MIVLQNPAHSFRIEPDLLQDAAHRLFLAAKEIDKADFASAGLDPRNDAVFRFADGATFRRMEYHLRVDHEYDRKLVLKGRGGHISVILNDCSRSPTSTSAPEVRRSMKSIANAFKLIAAAAQNSPDYLPDYIDLAARAVLAEADAIGLAKDRALGINKVSNRPATLAFATPWRRQSLRHYAATSSVNTAGSKILPQVIRLEAEEPRFSGNDAIEIKLSTKIIQDDPSKYDPVLHLRMIHALEKLKNAA